MNQFKKLLVLPIFLSSCALIGWNNPPAVPAPALEVMVIQYTDSVVAEIECGSVNWRSTNQISSCRWMGTKTLPNNSTTNLNLPAGFVARVSHVGNPADSVRINISAYAIRRGLESATAKTGTLWMKIKDVAPSAPDTLIIRVTP